MRTPNVQYAATYPGHTGSLLAAAGEFVISFLLMLTVLYVSNHTTLSPFTGLFAGFLVATYIAFEAPFSGMSMNPARTFASALPSGTWKGFWIYIVVPPLGMLAAAELFLKSTIRDSVRCCKMYHYFGTKEWPFPMGHISFVGKLDAVTLRAGAPAIAPGWTLEAMAQHSLDFWMTSEDLPDPENRVTLNRKGEITLSYQPNNQKAHEHLKKNLEYALNHIKCEEHGSCHQGLFARSLFLGQKIPLAGVAHQNGTIRFGDDPATSALDPNCKAHDLDNLYVVDGSFFPSSAAVNPGLTIIANALRVGDHLLERLRATSTAISSSSSQLFQTNGAQLVQANAPEAQ